MARLHQPLIATGQRLTKWISPKLDLLYGFLTPLVAFLAYNVPEIQSVST